jgi:competence protein ComEC
LLANLAVIPVSSAVLYLGLLTLAVSWIPYVSLAVAFLLKWTVWLLNKSVFLTEAIPGALIQGFSINLLEVICLYAMIVAALLFFHYKKLYYWIAIFVISCLLAIINIIDISYGRKQRQLVMYAINNHSGLSIIHSNKQIFLADSALLHNNALIDFHLKNFWWEKGIKKSTYLNLSQLQTINIPVRQWGRESLLVWQHKTFLFLHSPLPIGQEYSFPATDYLVVQHNALRKLDKLKNKVKYLIIDSTNKKYLANQLKQQAMALNIPCHSMHESGAFILSK